MADQVGFTPIDYSQIAQVSSVLKKSNVVSSARQTDSPKHVKTTRKSRRVVNFSDTTAAYDRQGNFPSLRNFQIVKAIPEYKPLGDLLEKNSGASSEIFIPEYTRFSENKPDFLDHMA